jgi:hypothetical protein
MNTVIAIPYCENNARMKIKIWLSGNDGMHAVRNLVKFSVLSDVL